MNRTTLAILLSLPLIGFILDQQNLLAPARSLTFQLTSPFTSAALRLSSSVRETAVAFSNIGRLMQENSELKAENHRLLAELADKADLIHENDLLRNELSLPEREGFQKGQPAFVVGRSSSGAFGTLTIDKGSRHGLKKGQIVVSEGLLVGTLNEVNETTSVVLPITNADSIIPAMLVESRGTGLLKGGVRGLTVTDIPRDVPIKIGEAVTTAALGGVVPSGILIGMVDEILGGQADVFQTVAVSSPLPFNWLEIVIVMP